MKPYRFSAKADADMLDISLYTRRKWGIAQMRRYVLALERGIVDLVEGKLGGKRISGLSDDLKLAHIEHHYIVLRLRENMPALVEAILHERMDIAAQLAERMKK